MAFDSYDAVVVGGGPAGATAAETLARAGRRVLMLDRDGRIKPCGGAIPPRLIHDFHIPDELLVARIRKARMVAPSNLAVDIPIDGGFVGMVDREEFDEWLRRRAVRAGVTRQTGTFLRIDRSGQRPRVEWRGKDGATRSAETRVIVGADGARSAVARAELPGGDRIPYVIAYHEIVRSPAEGAANDFDPRRCDVVYKGAVSPDFYGWVFPHGATTSIGMGTGLKGVDLRAATRQLRAEAGLADAETLREEGAPIPLKPLPRWDNGRDVVLAGDAAGVVAPASGEGIYYAMVGGQLAAEAAEARFASGRVAALRDARARFMADHGRVFWVLGMMQRYWYTTDRRRESFVRICEDRDVQTLTFDAYMNKRLVRAKPAAHLRIFMKNVAHLTGLARV